MIQSEREVAAVLDSLHVAWEYEPRLFVFLEDEKGFVREGFRPDFYLPRYDLYIEVTKAKQANQSDDVPQNILIETAGVLAFFRFGPDASALVLCDC